MGSSLFPQQIVNRPTAMSTATPQMINTMAMQQNPTLPAQNQTNNRDKILQLWNTIKNSNNPQQMFEQALNANSELKNTVNMINSMGDPQKLFFALAQKQGTDPNSILGLLK